MNILHSLKNLMKITQTRIGLVFAIFIPIFFIVVWMTGYHHATERIDQLNVAIVNEDGKQGQVIQEQIQNHAPFHTDIMDSSQEAQSQMDAGNYTMVIVIPNNLTQNITNNSNAKLTFYINQGNSQLATSMVEGIAVDITSKMGIPGTVQADIIQTHNVNDFATSMLPMILGFITYIAAMTMNIQFNISSQIMKRNHTKWQIFWSKQLLLLAISIVVPLLVIGVASLFTDVASSFWQMWFFHIVVTLACICFTQMSFALFGNAGPLFNIAMVPFQLMTAGNIIPVAMLAPFYRYIGNFLPASNGVQGFTTLIYSRGSVTGLIINLLLISIVTWGITITRIRVQKDAPRQSEPSFKPQIQSH
ncbi:YhgE/Pip-like protein [Paenibacillus sp. DS2015]|uniref:YhgE/Pip domain-containing protein n=1 Tax=Paenibacillus sp. DS2015 TaxID=3373917 RepID=UPI003D199658